MVVIEEKIIHMWVLANKQIYWCIYNFIHHEASPLSSPATYPRDTTFQCFRLFIFPSILINNFFFFLNAKPVAFFVK